MRGVSVAMVVSSGPPRAPVTASERPARRRASLRGPSRPGSRSPNEHRYRVLGQVPIRSRKVGAPSTLALESGLGMAVVT